jgi:hypothetical protein
VWNFPIDITFKSTNPFGCTYVEYVAEEDMNLSLVSLVIITLAEATVQWVDLILHQFGGRGGSCHTF